jgi:hypothetical protein
MCAQKVERVKIRASRATRRFASSTWFSMPSWSSPPNGEGHHSIAG